MDEMLFHVGMSRWKHVDPDLSDFVVPVHQTIEVALNLNIWGVPGVLSWYDR